MTLKEKLDIIRGYDEQDPYETFMTIVDEFAIEFVKFIETDKNVRYVGCVIEKGEEKQYSYNRKYYTTKELLKLFKKEKGL